MEFVPTKPWKKKTLRRPTSDTFATLVVSAFAIIAIIPFVSIIWAVWSRGHQGLHWSLFTQDMHSTAFTDEPLFKGGLIHAVIGSVLVVGAALVISVPIGVLTAIYLTEIRGRFTRPIRTEDSYDLARLKSERNATHNRGAGLVTGDQITDCQWRTHAGSPPR